MRIGFHCWEFPPTIVGGLGTYAQCVVQALAERGHQLDVWAPEQTHWKASVPPVRSPQVRERRVALFDATPAFPHVITDELRAWGRFFSDIFTFNFLAAAETRQVEGLDVIAIQDWLSGIAGLILAQESASAQRAPVVFHVHSTEWGRQPGGGSPPVHHFEGALGYHAQGVITVSEAMREDLIAHGWDANKIFAVWNGVDPERYRPDAVSAAQVEALKQRYGIGPDETVLLYVGRLTSVKGSPQLVEAMPAVLARHPNTHLVILGVGELEGLLAERVRALGLQDRVTLRYEFVDEVERITHYQMCDVAVFPSTYEPFGIVCLEAMAMGKPVVVGARGVVGFREQVIPSGEGQTGFHVDAGRPEDIAWGINAALRYPECWPEWGGNGRRRVLQEFTWAHAAQKTEAVYQEILARSRAALTT
jgi:glycosyltransferase involved in cell wall biosynthesis